MRTPTNESLSSDTSGTSHLRESGAERRCIISGQVGPRDALLRLAISPDGEVFPDALARAPGRGAWLGISRSQLETAMASGQFRGALARAFKGAALTVADDLPQRIEDALKRAFTDRLGMEMRSGRIVLGSDRIAEHARGGVLELLLHASDAAEDGSRKLDQAWRVGREIEGSGEQGIRLPLDRDALSVALGRENVVHLAVADARSASRVKDPLLRLQNYMDAAPAAKKGSGRGADNGPVGADDDGARQDGPRRNDELS